MADLALQTVDSQAIAMIREQDPDLSEALAKQFFLMRRGRDGTISLFIKRAGLLRKMEQKFSQSKYSIRAEIPNPDEIKAMREMLGAKPSDKFAVMKGVVEIHDTGEKFIDFGTATPANCRNVQYLLEMASTRATNRAIRLATNCGFTSVEEMPNDEKPAPPIPAPRPNPIMKEAINIAKKLGWDKITFIETMKEFLGKPKPETKEEAEEFLNHLRNIAENSGENKTKNRYAKIYAIKSSMGMTDEQLKLVVLAKYGKESKKDLSDEELKQLESWLETAQAKIKSGITLDEIMEEIIPATEVEGEITDGDFEEEVPAEETDELELPF